MYADHIRQCNDACQSGAESTARMLRFVLATIQQQLETVPRIMQDFEEDGPESRFAFGAKADGLRYLQTHAAEVYGDAMAARHDDIELMRVFLRVPGLGLVKAGFACQLFAGRVGCLDVHNIRLYDLDRNVLRIDKHAKRASTWTKRITDYVLLCEKLGGAVKLWAAWCEYKAEVSPKGNWIEMGESVSIMHVEACTGKWYETIPQFMLFTDEPRFKGADDYLTTRED